MDNVSKKMGTFHNDAMQVLGIPDVVVLEPVDIDVQTIVVHVRVRHEMYSSPSSALPS